MCTRNKKSKTSFDCSDELQENLGDLSNRLDLFMAVFYRAMTLKGGMYHAEETVTKKCRQLISPHYMAHQ